MADSHTLHRHHALIGILCAVIAALAFSGKAILVKLAYRYSVDAVTLLALRMLFSLPFFFAVAMWSARNMRTSTLDSRDWGAVVVLGLLGYYLGSLFDFLGLTYISASLERLILFLYPTLVLVLSALLLRRRISARELLAFLLSYLGIVLAFIPHLSVDESGLIIGAGLVFASALTYALYLIGSGATIAKIGAARFTAYSMTVASAAILVQFGITHAYDGHVASALHLPLPVYTLALAMALFCTVMPAFLLAESLRRIGAGKTAIIGSIGPVATLALGALFLGETISALQLVGTGLVVSGVLWISLRKTA